MSNCGACALAAGEAAAFFRENRLCKKEVLWYNDSADAESKPVPPAYHRLRGVLSQATHRLPGKCCFAALPGLRWWYNVHGGQGESPAVYSGSKKGEPEWKIIWKKSYF